MLLTYLALIALLLSSFSEAFRKYSAARRTATLSATLRTGPVFCLNVNLYIQNDRRAEFIEVIKKNHRQCLHDVLLRLDHAAAFEKNDYASDAIQSIW